MFMSILAVGALCGPPISGAIETATGDFKLVGVFAGELFKISIVECSIDLLRQPQSWLSVLHA